MTDNPVDLDHHRGMAAQKATDLRRLLAEVATNEHFGPRKTSWKPS